LGKFQKLSTHPLFDISEMNYNRNMIKNISPVKFWSFGLVFVLVFILSWVIFPHGASAAGKGLDTADYILFRIDTELNVLNGKGVTVQWSCGGGAVSGSYKTKYGLVTDGTASDSDYNGGVPDGIIEVASASAENTGTNGSGCDVNEALTATASLNGWVNRTWTSPAISNTATPFITGASMDYNIVVTGVNDKLNYPLTLDGAIGTAKHASASYSGTIASSSYSGGVEYIAGSTFGGTVAASANGYLRRVSGPLSISATASQSVDFGTTTAGMVHATGLDYNLWVTGINDELGNTLTLNGITASASYGGSYASASYSGGKRYFAILGPGTMTGGADGYVNEAISNVSFSAYSDYTGASASLDFTSGTTSTYNGTALPFGHKIEAYVSGGTFASNPITTGVVTAGNSYGTQCSESAYYWYCAVPLANTETSVRYVSSGWVTTTATYADRVSGADPQTTATLIVSPSGGGGSSSGGGSYTPIITPTPPFIILNTPTPIPLFTPTPTPTLTFTPLPTMTPPHIVVGRLYRTAGDSKVYVQNSDGTLSWVKSLAEFNAAGYSWKNVQVVTPSVFNQLSTSGITSGGVTMQVTAGKLNVRSSASTAGKILGKLSAGQQVQTLGKSGAWYEINYNGVTAWVNGNYLK
jgi:hypothetical protein